MHGDDYENTQEGNNVFLLEVDSLQKLGHNFFGILVTCILLKKSFGGIRGILMDLSCRCEK